MLATVGQGARLQSAPKALCTAHLVQVQALAWRTPVCASRLAAAAARNLQQRPCHTCQWRALHRQCSRKAAASRSSRAATAPRAMVNVDFSPALVLGLGMVGGGLLLYNVRLSRPWISRDYDVVISSVSILTGGILVFQGWRLDPLLLFGQLLTAGTAVAFALEVFRLREAIATKEVKAEEQDGGGRWGPTQTQSRWSLPLPKDERDYQRWSSVEPQQRDSWPATYSEQQDVYEDDQLYNRPEDRRSPPSYGSSPSDNGDGNSGSGSKRQQSGDYQSWGRRVDYDEVEDW